MVLLSRADPGSRIGMPIGTSPISPSGLWTFQGCNLGFFEDIPPEAYGLADAEIHHEYEHKSDPISYYRPGAKGNLEAEEGMIKRNIYQSNVSLVCCSVYGQIPEGSGSMLDNTLVVYVSDLANGNHGMEFCPCIGFW